MRSILFGAIALVAAPLPVLAQGKAHPPIPQNRESWIRGDNYPAAALRARAEGRVSFTLAIDATGRPIACRITQTSGNADLDAMTCRLFAKNGRFAAAADNDGASVAGEWSGAMDWVLPN